MKYKLKSSGFWYTFQRFALILFSLRLCYRILQSWGTVKAKSPLDYRNMKSLTFLSKGCFQYAEPTKGYPAGLTAAGLPTVSGGSGQHPPHYPGCSGTQRVSLPVPSSSTDEGNTFFYSTNRWLGDSYFRLFKNIECQN